VTCIEIGWGLLLNPSDKDYRKMELRKTVRIGGGCNWLRIVSIGGIWY
jgi:hypothetical protein